MRCVDDLIGGAIFHLFAVAQHKDMVGNLRHDGQIMGDIQCCHPGFADGAFDGGQDVDLGGHIQRGGGFVKDHQIGLGAKRHRRHHALQLTARHLMGIAVADGFGIGQRKLAEQRDGPRLGLGLGAKAMADAGFNHLLHQPLGGVKAGSSGLADISHLAPP